MGSWHFGARYAYIAAHEIVHNFDNIGMLISNERKLEPWLTGDSVAAFGKRTQCLVEQYGSLPITLRGLGFGHGFSTRVSLKFC